MPFSNELLAAAGINPYENDKATPPPFLQNDLDKQLNQNQKMPATLDELADARGLKSFRKTDAVSDKESANKTLYI